MIRYAFRYALPLAAVLLATACERSLDAGLRALNGEAAAAEDSQVIDEFRSDTSETVTRRIWTDDAGIVGPSPDGERIALTDWITGDIAVVDVATGDSSRITENSAPYHPGFGMFPVFSPDGQRIAFNWWNRERPLDWQLRIANAGGGEARVLTDGSGTTWIQPEDWSPDGTWIVAVHVREDNTNQIVLVSTADGTVHALKTLDWRAPIRMNFSPDGDWIVYDFPPDEETQERDIYLLAVDGSREVHLIADPANDFVLGWAPTGDILFSSDRSGTPGAWLLPMKRAQAAGAPVLVKADLFNSFPFAFLRDGSYMFGVRSGSRGLYVGTLDPETGRFTGTPELRVPNAGRAAWSPDGRHFAFLVPPAAPVLRAREIEIRSLETGEVNRVRLDSRLTYAQRLFWLPGSTGLLVASNDEQGKRGVYRVDPRTGDVEAVLTKGPEVHLTSFEATPDGRYLVFNEEDVTGEPAYEGRIVVHDLVTGEERVLYRMMETVERNIRQLAVSPDGVRLAWVVWNEDRPRSELMVLPITGGEPASVTRGEIESQPRWSPDSRHLLYARRVDEEDFMNPVREMVRVPVEGGEPESTGIRMEELRGIEVHAPSNRISFTAGEVQNELWIMENFLGDGQMPARASAAGSEQ